MPKTSLQRVKNPTGRLDWLAAALLARMVEQKADPVLSAVYAEIRTPLEQALRKSVGPRNRTVRDLRKYIEQGNAMLTAAQSRRRMA